MGRAYRLTRSRRLVNAAMRPFFDVNPDSPLEAIEAEAPRHPVFRIRERDAS